MSLPSLHAPTALSRLLTSDFIQYGCSGLVTTYARKRIMEVLAKGILVGVLIISEDDKSTVFGTQGAGQSVTIKVNSLTFWLRMLLSYDVGFSEAYMEGECEVSNLKDMFNLWIDNKNTLSDLSGILSTLLSSYSALAINILGGHNHQMAKWNVEVAYDTSNFFFQCFLSKEMMYSCAIWGEEEGGVRGDITIGPRSGDLEAAQSRKIHLVLKNARVRPGDRVLEIGSGWGAMAIAAARLGCTVDTVTLSRQQMIMIQSRANEAGVGDMVRVHLCDYRDLPTTFEHAFDAMISSEMIEAVGPRNLPEFFRVMDWALKPDRATMVITSTCQPEHRWVEYQADDFARHYHWPNTQLPSATSLAVAVQKSVPKKFILHQLEDHGIHYPRTLREWGRRLERNFKGEVVQELRKQYPTLASDEALAAFKRKWMYMFAYAEVGYARAYTSLNCWTFARPENPVECCA